MLTVPLLLVAIFVTVLILILYLIIYNDFNENELDNRIRVMTEYVKRTNAEFPTPEFLSYVSCVQGHSYTLTTFLVNGNLDAIHSSQHDDRVETFNFLKQSLEPVYIEDAIIESRIASHPADRAKFLVRGDDAWIELECPPDTEFDAATLTCESVPVCRHRSPGNYGLTESLIDSLLLNHNVNRDSQQSDKNNVHLTMYLRCFEGGSHAVLECPADHVYDNAAAECALRNYCENKPDNYVLNVDSEHLNYNEFYSCLNNKTVVSACPENQTFDRRMLICVDTHACSVHGANYTYITDAIENNQYYKCISNNEAELITCINRTFVDGRYQCAGNVLCTGFANGSGTLVRTHSDTILQYNTGVLVCDNYELIRDLNCNTDNLLDTKIFNDKFKASLNLPVEVFDESSDSCAPLNATNLDLVTIKNPYFYIESLPNDLNVSYETAMIGQTDKLAKLLDGDRLDEAVVYAKNRDAVGLDASTGEPIDCYGNSALYDVFDATRFNNCTDSNELQRQTVLNNDEYVKSTTLQIGRDTDYDASCVNRLNQIVNFVKMDHFTVSILTNILPTDPCGLILNDLTVKYSSNPLKYTTLGRTHAPNVEKQQKYMGKSNPNNPKTNTTIYANGEFAAVAAAAAVAAPVDGNDTIAPAFNPFTNVELTPAFNPFALSSPSPEYQFESDETGAEEGDAENDVEDGGSDPEPDSPEFLTKIVEFSCFYALPTFKLSECQVNGVNIKTELKRLRENITLKDADCAPAVGLGNIINSYAYIGSGVGCRSAYEQETGVYVYKTANPIVYANLETQSDDGVRYNNYVYKNENEYLACPPDLITDTLQCNLDDNSLYYLESLQM
nr:vp91 [Calliteara abietis nucleopolyhedrovirus]